MLGTTAQRDGLHLSPAQIRDDPRDCQCLPKLPRSGTSIDDKATIVMGDLTILKKFVALVDTMMKLTRDAAGGRVVELDAKHPGRR